MVQSSPLYFHSSASGSVCEAGEELRSGSRDLLGVTTIL
jgi:hypothetical protein